MLLLENAVRVTSTPNGKRWYHLCFNCGKEIGPNSTTALKTRSGLCNRCFKSQQSEAGKALLTRIRGSARGRTTVSLTPSDCAFLQDIKTCCYCGKEVDWTKKSRINIDRVDSNLGYEWGNVVVCCFDCNRVKNNLLTGDEMRMVALLLRFYRSVNDTERNELSYYLVSGLDRLAP
jgi:hypothetical protein